MRIAMVGLKGVPYPEGIENFTEQVGSRLVGRGHSVTVYTRPYVEVGDSYRGMRIRRLPSINTKHLDALSHTFLGTVDVLRSGHDIVHYHALGPSVFSLIPRLRGVRTVAHVHGLDWQRRKWGLLARACLRAAELSAAYFPDRTITISEVLKQYFEARYRRAVEYVPTGVEEYDPEKPREILRWGLEAGSYILFLSRLVPEKGCHLLLEAYERLRTDKKLVIAGAPSHSDQYAASLRRTRRSGVVFTGGVKGRLLRELFSNAYLYVLPSEIEGLPHALLQALSFGRCVLASDIEPNREALGDCGLTFRSGDVEDLRRQLDRLVHDATLVQERARNARARVHERYSWEVVVSRLEEVYRRCLEGPRLDEAGATPF
jgi:glycosyltransferase involved in cell wall biosynthesis